MNFKTIERDCQYGLLYAAEKWKNSFRREVFQAS